MTPLQLQLLELIAFLLVAVLACSIFEDTLMAFIGYTTGWLIGKYWNRPK